MTKCDVCVWANVGHIPTFEMLLSLVVFQEPKLPQVPKHEKPHNWLLTRGEQVKNIEFIEKTQQNEV